MSRFRPHSVLVPALIALPLLAAALGSVPASGADSVEFFESRIRPLLIEHCHDCHAVDSKTQGGLALDSRTALLQGGDSGPAVVPGKPDDSLLLKAVRHLDPELKMPAKKPKLSEAAISDLTSWIRNGAAWPDAGTNGGGPSKATFNLAARKAQQPWLWQTPRSPAIPQPARTSSRTTDIDRFLLARLEEKGIDPAPPADDRTWLRRVHAGPTGLPPAPEGARSFAEDKSPDKRERLVRSLLDSPQFGERWARHWMDLMRYAESRGHESDFRIPNAWQYRDYLVRAFNADVPYDRFLSEHLAGDLLAPRVDPATGANDAVIATGWAFLGEEVHSPVDIRQDECERIDNKIDVFSKTFVGLTVACARCHDHKFDPISQRDYYALSGVFLGASYRQARIDTAEAHTRTATELERIRTRHRPAIAAALAEAARPGASRLADPLLAARRILVGESPDVASRAAGVPLRAAHAWVDALRSAATNRSSGPLALLAKLAVQPDIDSVPPEEFRKRLASLRSGSATASALPADPRVLADYSTRDRVPWKTDGPVFGGGPRMAGEVVFGDSGSPAAIQVQPYGAARRDAFWNRLGVEPGTEGESSSIDATGRAGRMLATPTFQLGVGKLHYLIRGRTRVYAAVDSHIMVAGPLHGGLMASFDGGTGEPTWVTHDLSAYSDHRLHLEFAPDGDGPLEIVMVVESPEKPAFRPMPDGLESAAEAGSFAELVRRLQTDYLAAAETLAPDRLIATPRLAPFAADLARHRILFAGSTNALAAFDQAVARLAKETSELAGATRWTSRMAVAWFDGTGVDDRVLLRGKPARPGDVAPRALPSVFGLPAVNRPDSSGRAELARQLVDPAHPLVARVIVNRVWQHVHGRGIVGTPDNFGFLGERPTHPELLDHLAWQFVHEDHWSIKRLLRRLVLTEAFARSSRAATGKAAEIDPANTLLHRMPVRRLEAEAIRDAILAVSGRLDPKLGGPPIPVHLTEFIIGRGRPDRSGPLDGEGRRSLYTAVPRNFLPTMMVAFDYPTPFSTVGRRNTTNVPGQPLTLMNDPFLHDQARFWADRVLRTMPGAADEARVRWMFETAFARPPADDELHTCLASLGDLRSLHASAMTPTRDTAPWADFAHALLTANEFLYLN